MHQPLSSVSVIAAGVADTEGEPINYSDLAGVAVIQLSHALHMHATD